MIDKTGDNFIGVIQAGGKGTRMRVLTKDIIPKPMLKISGKPMIQHQLENMIEYGINDFVIITGHLGNVIRDYFKDGSSLGCHIEYISRKSY